MGFHSLTHTLSPSERRVSFLNSLFTSSCNSSFHSLLFHYLHPRSLSLFGAVYQFNQPVWGVEEKEEEEEDRKGGREERMEGGEV